MSEVSPVIDGPTVTVARAAELLHCGRTVVFRLLDDGQLKRAPKFGRKTLIKTASVYRLIGELPPESEYARKRRARTTQRAAFLRDAFDMGSGSSGCLSLSGSEINGGTSVPS